jgi:hypothetical protein
VGGKAARGTGVVDVVISRRRGKATHGRGGVGGDLAALGEECDGSLLLGLALRWCKNLHQRPLQQQPFGQCHIATFSKCLMLRQSARQSSRSNCLHMVRWRDAQHHKQASRQLWRQGSCFGVPVCFFCFHPQQRVQWLLWSPCEMCNSGERHEPTTHQSERCTHPQASRQQALQRHAPRQVPGCCSD